MLARRMQYPFKERNSMVLSHRKATALKVLTQAYMAGDSDMMKEALKVLHEPGIDLNLALGRLQDFYENRLLFARAHDVAAQRLHMLPAQTGLRLQMLSYDALEDDWNNAKKDMSDLLRMKASVRFVASGLLKVLNAGNFSMVLRLADLVQKAGYKGTDIQAVRFTTLLAMGKTAQARAVLSHMDDRVAGVLGALAAQDPRYSLKGLNAPGVKQHMSVITACHLSIDECDASQINTCLEGLRAMGVDGTGQASKLLLYALQEGCNTGIHALFGFVTRPGVSQSQEFASALNLANTPVDVINRLPATVRKEIGGFILKQVGHALRLQPEEAWYYSVMATAKGFSGDWHAAMAYLDKALTWFGGNALLMNNTAYLLSLLNMWPQDSLNLVSKARILDPSQDSYYAETEAWAIYKAGHKKQGLKAELNAVRYMTRSSGDGISEGFYHLGLMNLQLGHITQALRAFRVSQFLYPDSIFGRRSFLMLNKLLKRVNPSGK